MYLLFVFIGRNYHIFQSVNTNVEVMYFKRNFESQGHISIVKAGRLHHGNQQRKALKSVANLVMIFFQT